MAINVENIGHEFPKLDDNIHDELFTIILNNKEDIVKKIKQEINDRFSIEEKEIEELVLSSLIYPLEYSQNTLADTVVDKVDTITSIASKEKEDTPEERTSSKLTFLLNEMLRTISGSNLDNLKNDFLISVKAFLDNKGFYTDLSKEEIEKKSADIQNVLKNYLTKVMEHILMSSKKAIKNSVHIYREALESSQKKESISTTSEISPENGLSSLDLNKYTDLLAEVLEDANVQSETLIGDMSIEEIDNRLYELSQDMKVQEYLTLINRREEIKNSQENTYFGPTL